MLDLSPTKLIIIFIVVVVLLGPKRLPEVARQLGAGWRKLRDFHGQLDRELRQTMPDLPSSQDIVRFARSPLTLLNQLADQPVESPEPLSQDGSVAAGAGTGTGTEGAAATNGSVAAGAPPGGAPNTVTSNGDGSARPVQPRRPGPAKVAVPSLAKLDTDDPNLN